MSNKKHTEIPLNAHNVNGEFQSSLDSFSAQDIGAACDKRFKSRSKLLSDILHYGIIGICAVVFLVCLILVINNLVDKARGSAIYDAASELITPITLNDASKEDKGDSPVMTPYERIEAMYGAGDVEITDSAYDLDLASVKASLSSLKQLNSEVAGWIYVENTRINYPLMHSESGNDEYYLTHAYTGEYLAVGSIYLVNECSTVLTENYNSLIYGHNVVNGSMFHDVTKFFDEEFFNSTLIYIYTLDGAYIYKPFSIYQTVSDYNYIQTIFTNENEFLNFAAEVASNTTVASDERISSGDTMITLSTCTNGGVGGPGRFALHAKLVAVVK